MVVMLWAAGVAQATPEGLDDVMHALSMRHPVPCAELEAKTTTPTETLLHVVDTVTMPPWAPMRAAQCLVDNHPLEVSEQLQTWVVDPELRGLGRLVLGSLDALPAEVAVPVATKALAGSDPDLARERIGAAKLPEVRAVLETP